jgi:hypothetical protein
MHIWAAPASLKPSATWWQRNHPPRPHRAPLPGLVGWRRYFPCASRSGSSQQRSARPPAEIAEAGRPTGGILSGSRSRRAARGQNQRAIEAWYDKGMTAPTPANTAFSTRIEIQVLVRPLDSGGDWTEFDRGPGYFNLPEDSAAAVRAHGLNDRQLAELAADLANCAPLRYLNLSENRNVTDAGLVCLKALPQLTLLNLSSCALTSAGMANLTGLPRLEWLDLSYCNRLTDDALRPLKKLARLQYLNLQGCVKITNGGVARLRRAGLTINK